MIHVLPGYWYAFALTAPALLARLVDPGARTVHAPRAMPLTDQRAYLPLAAAPCEYLARVSRLSPGQVDELARRHSRGPLRALLHGLASYRGARRVQQLVRQDPDLVAMDDVRMMARLATGPSGELCTDAFMALWEGYAALVFREHLPPKLFRALYAPSEAAVPLDALSADA